MKVMLKATKESQDRDHKRYQSELSNINDQLDRERLEFSRERDSMVKRYEQALQSKDQAHRDSADQLKTMQKYLASNIGNGRTLEMEARRNSNN